MFTEDVETERLSGTKWRVTLKLRETPNDSGESLETESVSVSTVINFENIVSRSTAVTYGEQKIEDQLDISLNTIAA